MLRRSKQREKILNVLRKTTSHPGAEWIYEQVKKEIPNVSLGTVYRNLNLLREAGRIQELDYSGELSRFDGNISTHYHFRCDNCGCIFDLDEVADRRLERKIAQKTGFKVTSHRLEFRGVCRDCLNSHKDINYKQN